MLVEEVDATRVDSLGNVLADLVRASPVDHVESSPSVLRLGTCRGADKERVLHLALEVVLLDIVGHSGRDLPEEAVSAIVLGVCFAPSSGNGSRALGHNSRRGGTALPVSDSVDEQFRTSR